MKISNSSFTRNEIEKLYNDNLALAVLVSDLRIENSICRAKYLDLKKATDHLDLQGLNPILNPKSDGSSK